MAKIKSFAERIADALVEDGLLSANQIEELLEQQKKEGARLVKLIVDKDRQYVSRAGPGRLHGPRAECLAHQSRPHQHSAGSRRIAAARHRAQPQGRSRFSRLENKLFLAMADPLNVLAIDDVRRITKLEIAPLIASEKAIIDKLNALDAAKGGSMEDIIQDARKEAEAEADADTLEAVKEALEEVNLDQLAASSEEAPVIKLANLIIRPGHQGPRQRHASGAV